MKRLSIATLAVLSLAVAVAGCGSQSAEKPSAYRGWTQSQIAEAESRFQAGAKSTKAQAKCAVNVIAGTFTFAEDQDHPEDPAVTESIVQQCHT